MQEQAKGLMVSPTDLARLPIVFETGYISSCLTKLQMIS